MSDQGNPVEAPLWEIVIEVVDKAAVPHLEAILEGYVSGVASFEQADGTSWKVTGYAETAPDEAAIEAGAGRATVEAGIAPAHVHIALMPPTDWVAEVEKSLKPIHVGPYYVYGSHITGPPPPGAVPLKIDAGLAFGTGSHETTSGCLLALEALYPETGPVNPLDVGTGSGILAIALAKRYGGAVLGSDIDPIAVRVAAENADINGVAGLVRFLDCPGLDAPEIAGGAPYDLIIANIVANPLIALAPDIAGALAPGGKVILSGLLSEQVDDVSAAYRTEGLVVQDTVPLNNWRTLVLTAA